MSKGSGFKTGDLVQLKSGGPIMTVGACSRATLDNEDNVQCVWFSGSKHQTAWFREDSLEPAKIERK
jgi:uncharacterized protein YodC (DUF2158 family)